MDVMKISGNFIVVVFKIKKREKGSGVFYIIITTIICFKFKRANNFSEPEEMRKYILRDVSKTLSNIHNEALTKIVIN